jgi:23S rRNA-/tRNA-specific pseudouridylate synthase
MIIYENEHLIVINKDNGVPSQMGTGLSIDTKSEIAVDKMLEAYLISNRI